MSYVTLALRKILIIYSSSARLLHSAGAPSTSPSLPMMECLATASNAHNLKFFTKAFLIAVWELWKLCNDKIF
jgi:hypothetical protein